VLLFLSAFFYSVRLLSILFDLFGVCDNSNFLLQSDSKRRSYVDTNDKIIKTVCNWSVLSESSHRVVQNIHIISADVPKHEHSYYYRAAFFIVESYK
jgi:hypothetical protein